MGVAGALMYQVQGGSSYSLLGYLVAFFYCLVPYDAICNGFVCRVNCSQARLLQL